MTSPPPEANPGPGSSRPSPPAVGLAEVELCRYVLERCADVEEALEALRLARHYYFLHPLLYRYPTSNDLPPGEGTGLTYARFRTLSSLFSGQAELSPQEIAQCHAVVRFTPPDVPVRTLWYALYDPGATSMQVSFHVRDTEHGEVRTPLQEFSLSQVPVAR